MINVSDFLETNNKFIERFVDLTLCRDTIYDSIHRWYYSLIPLDKLLAYQYILTEDDIRSDIHLNIIEHAQSYYKSPKLFKQYLQKDLIWFLKSKINSLIKQSTPHLISDNTHDCIDEFSLDQITLKNIFHKVNSSEIHDKYLLYLYSNKCYTINQIADLLYRERSSIRKDLKNIAHRSSNGKRTN